LKGVKGKVRAIEEEGAEKLPESRVMFLLFSVTCACWLTR
jgi:hypothetical protein